MADPAGEVTGRVTARRFRGEQTTIVVDTDAGPVLELTVRWRPVPEVEDRLRLRLDPAEITVLGDGTGGSAQAGGD